MLCIAICDDNPKESDHLSGLLHQYAKKHQLKLNIQVFSNGFLFLEAIEKKNGFHLCFLDIFMPAFTGIETAKELRLLDPEMHLVFCSSSPDFALDGYTLQASHYLVKPVKDQPFFKAMDQIMGKIFREQRGKPGNSLCIPTATGFQKLSSDEVSHVVASNNSTLVHLRNLNILASTQSFSKIWGSFAVYPNFAIISRSIFLNYDVVTGMEQDKFILESDIRIQLPRRKKKEITQDFLDYSMGS